MSFYCAVSYSQSFRYLVVVEASANKPCDLQFARTHMVASLNVPPLLFIKQSYSRRIKNRFVVHDIICYLTLGLVHS